MEFEFYDDIIIICVLVVPQIVDRLLSLDESTPISAKSSVESPISFSCPPLPVLTHALPDPSAQSHANHSNRSSRKSVRLYPKSYRAPWISKRSCVQPVWSSPRHCKHLVPEYAYGASLGSGVSRHYPSAILFSGKWGDGQNVASCLAIVTGCLGLPLPPTAPFLSLGVMT